MDRDYWINRPKFWNQFESDLIEAIFQEYWCAYYNVSMLGLA